MAKNERSENEEMRVSAGGKSSKVHKFSVRNYRRSNAETVAEWNALKVQIDVLVAKQDALFDSLPAIKDEATLST